MEEDVTAVNAPIRPAAPAMLRAMSRAKADLAKREALKQAEAQTASGKPGRLAAPEWYVVSETRYEIGARTRTYSRAVCVHTELQRALLLVTRPGASVAGPYAKAEAKAKARGAE